MILSRRNALLVFFALALMINLAAAQMVRQFAAAKPAVAAGALVDMTLVVPAMYYLLLVRPGLQGRMTLPGIALLGLLRASFVIPQLAGARVAIASACELALAAFSVWRLRRAAGTLPDEAADVTERLEAACQHVVAMTPLARAVAGELAVVWYALFSWRARPHVPGGARAFTIHRESGVATLFGFLAAVAAGEVVAVHFVVAKWSHTGAWLASAAGTYGLLWLVAMARSTVLRPVLLTEDSVVIRFGILRCARVPFRTIASLRVADGRVAITMAEAVRVDGPYGTRRSRTTVETPLDRWAEFREALSAAVPGIGIE